MFQVRLDGDHKNQVQESPLWEPEPPDPGEIQVGPLSKDPGEAQVGAQSPVQVRPRYITEYPAPSDVQVRTRVNRYKRGPNIV